MPPSALCLLATSPASHPAEPVVMTHSSQPALSASSEPAAAPLQQHRCRSSRRWSTTSRPTPRSAGHLQLGGSFRQPRAGRDSDGRALLVLAGGLLAHRVLPALRCSSANGSLARASGRRLGHHRGPAAPSPQLLRDSSPATVRVVWHLLGQTLELPDFLGVPCPPRSSSSSGSSSRRWTSLSREATTTEDTSTGGATMHAELRRAPLVLS